MVANLAAKQLKQTRMDMERALKQRDRDKLRKLRESIRAAKTARRTKLRAVTAQCKAARKRNVARAKKAREKLRESIRRTREQARKLCTTARGEARAKTMGAIERAVSALEGERALQRQLGAWTRPKSCPTTPGGAREKRSESDCEVAANIDEPGLRVVWERVKGKIRGSGRRSRTEAFYEWVAENAPDVYRIQEEDAERALEQLEREERRLQAELRKASRYRGRSPEELRELLADVPF